MRRFIDLYTLLFLAASIQPAASLEGPTAAGPIGGTDIRSAILPPPGVYGGVLFLTSHADKFVDGEGRVIPALETAKLTKTAGAPFMVYVPNTTLFGGSVAIAGMVPGGFLCGHLFDGEKNSCSGGLGDPYVEIDWSRSFGYLRPSKEPGAYPIFEGTSLMLGFGAVVPVGTFTAVSPTKQALSIGNNLWAFAPSVAVTHTTAPIFAEGTEISAKFYWNNYIENPDTDYTTGDLLNLDFALTERVGRFQVGIAGFYAIQVEKDEGPGVPDDGRKAETLQVGPVINYDMPEYAITFRLKGLTSVFTENTVESKTVLIGLIQKF